MAAARAYGGTRAAPARLALGMVAWSALSLLPDLDVLAFRFGIPYAHPFGHRGASHSLMFALLVGALIGGTVRARGGRALCTTGFAIAVLASHGLLDTLTDGGLGCALLWPFSHTRFFAPVTPIPVAPIGRGLLSWWGARVFAVELVLFAPLIAYALWPRRLSCRR